MEALPLFSIIFLLGGAACIFGSILAVKWTFYRNYQVDITPNLIQSVNPTGLISRLFLSVPKGLIATLIFGLAFLGSENEMNGRSKTRLNYKTLINSLLKKTIFFLTLISCFWVTALNAQSITETFPSSGTFTFTAPPGVTSINVQAWGGGGAGGGASGSNNRQGGGGGGGAYRITNNVTVIPGTSYTIVIGNGGTGSTGNGSAGGQTIATFGATVVTANGGAGGTGANSGNGNGGNGGTGGTYNGGSGANGTNNGGRGGGGSSAGTASAGNNGSNSNTSGGSAPAGGGDGGDGGNGTNGSVGQGPGGGGGGGERTSSTNRSGGNGAAGQVIITYTPPYLAQFISSNLGSSTWCPGETRDVTVTIRNAGSATWTNSSPDINIGVKWNSNGANWADYYVRTDAGNLAPGATRTYTLSLTASNNIGAGYTTPLAAGSNNITFDVVNEGNFWFGNTSGNSVYTSSAITILASPTALPGGALAAICQGQQSAAMGGSVGGSASGGIWSGGAGTWANATNPSTARYTAGASESGSITLTLTTTGSCGPATATKTITVNPSPTVNAGAALPDICQGGTSAALGGSVGGAATGGTWSSNVAGGTFTPNATTLNATWAPPAAYIGTATLTLTTSGGSCGTVTAAKTLTVSPNKFASTPASTTVCAVAGTVNISHTTGGVSSIGAATGLPTGVTASFAGGIITITGSPTQIGTFNYSIPLNGTCGPAANATGTIIVENCACEEFIYSGSGNWPVPNGVTSIIIETWGGGGSGGTRTSDGQGGGGGGGGYSRSIFTVTSGQSYTYVVGAGGSSGGNGGNTTFTLGANSVLARGGSGVANNTTGGGNGGALGTGDVRWIGGNGATASGSASGGGGSSAAAGSDGVNGSVTAGGVITGGGNGGNGTATNDVAGEAGSAPGGGGGGAKRTGSTNIAGGTGGAGQIKITYTLNAGVISGTQFICVGATSTLSSTQAGGTWSSSNTAVATVNSSTGVVTGVGAGVASIRYTIVGVCAVPTSTRSVFVTQPLNPGTLSGNQAVCIGGTSQFISTTTNGTWSSSNPAIATVSSTGLVTAISAGTSTISYTLPASGGCPPSVATRTITVSTPPVAGTLSGNQAICVAGTTTLSSTSPGGIWSSGNSAIATVNSTTGVVTGIAQGTAIFTYTVAGTGGCLDASATRSVTVTAPPNAGILSGSNELCEGEGTIYLSTMPGGTWSSSNSSIATVDPSTGEVNAVSYGTANITYTVTGTGGCADAMATQTLTVYALPIPTFTAEPTSDICVGDEVTYTTQAGQFDYEWDVDGTAGADYTITAGGIGTSSNTVSIKWLTEGPQEVSVNYSNANGCDGINSASNSITINPLPVPTFTAEPSDPACIGDVFTYTTQPGQTNYTWTVPGNAGTDYNITAGGIGTSSNTVSIEWLTNGTKTVTVNYIDANGCTGINPASNTIDLDPLPVPTFTVSPSNPVCIGDAVTYTTQAGQSNYSWVVPGTAGTDYNITAGGIGTTNNTVSIRWLTSGTKTVTVNYQDANGCSGVNPASNTINLDPLPVPTFTVAPSNPVCIGDIETYTTQAGQANYIWTVSGTAGTDYNITSGGIGTASNTVTIQWLTAGAKTVTVNYQDANGCSGISSASNTVDISIYTAIYLQPDNTHLLECFGDGFDPLSVSATGSNLSYQWYIKPDDSAIGTNPGTAILGATLSTFTPPSTPEGVSYYYVIVTGNCDTETSTLSGRRTVNPSGTLITDDPDVFDETICFGDPPFTQLVVAALGDGGSAVTYQWYQQTTPVNTGGVMLSGENNATFTPPSNASLADGLPRYYYATASSSCGTVPTAISGAFTVNPLTSIDAENLSGSEICEDEVPFAPISVTASGTGTLSYQWYSNTTGVINTGTDNQVGTNTDSFTPPSNVADGIAVYYYVVVSSSGGCGPDQTSSISGAFVVNPLPVPTFTSAPTADVCVGTSVTYTTEAGQFNYSWNVPGTAGTDYTITAGGIGTTSNSVTLTWLTGGSKIVSVNYANASNCTAAAPVTNTITVNTLPVPTFTTAPSADVCVGTSVTYTTQPGQSNYVWNVPGTAGTDYNITAGGIGTSNNSVTLTWLTGGNKVVSVNYTNASNCSAASPISNSIGVNTLPVPTFTAAPSADVCVGTSVVYTTQPGQSNYSWNVPGTAGTDYTITAGGIGTASNSVTLTWLTNGTKAVSVNYSNASNCTATTPVTNSIVVNTVPVPTFISAPSANVCTGNSVTYTTQPGQSNYVWNVPGTAGTDYNITAGGIGASNNSVTLTWLTVGTKVISVNYTNAFNCTAAAPVTNSTTVNPLPAVNNFNVTPICSGTSFTVSPVDGTDGVVPAGTTYTWTVANNTNVTGETAQPTPQPSISQTLVNTTTVDQTVTYTVTPTSPAGCLGNPFQVTVTVKPTPTVNDPSDQAAVCSGTPSTAVNFSGNGVSGVVYNWTNSNPSIGLAASGTGNIPSFTTQNSGTSQISATITVTPTANGCTGPSQSFTIKVNPSPIITLLADYCSVAGSVQLIASSSVPGTTWLWNTGETTSSVTVDIAGLYSVTATAPGGCTSSTSLSVAEELIIDGSFTNFVANNLSFSTEYTQNQNYYVNGNGATGLWPEGYYAVNVNANGTTTTTPPGYHTSFYGRDHTNNATGPRNFLMVNGGKLIGSPLRQPIIWEQTVTVEPNTDYYFSAWAMNLNPGTPAKLQFEINGELVGTILDLNTAPKPTSDAQVGLDNWREFRSNPSWSSGSATQAVIKIINLNTTLNGNDFALDDISFGTLSPFIKLKSPAGTDDNQVVCENSPIVDIEYAVGGGLAGPVVDNLPPGVTSVWNGVNLRFSGSPTTAGTYNYTIFTTGACLQVQAHGTIVVKDTPTEGTIASDQTVCAGDDPAAIIGDAYVPQEVGATISYRWELNTNLGTPNWTNVPGNPSGKDYDPSVLTGSTQYRRYTISTVGGLSCESPPTNPVTITLQSVPTTGTIAAPQTICSGVDPVAFTSTSPGTGDGNISYRWEFTNSSNPSWTPIAGATGETYDSPPLTETTQFRRVTISTLNGIGCASAPTSALEVTILPNNTAPLVNPDPPLCLNEALPITIIHTTTGATGITNDGVPGANGLPAGVDAKWSGNTITIQGTPTEMGVFNYNIPLTGGCGTVSATGTITVENPTYPIIAINVVNPATGSTAPYTSEFTVYSNELTIGNYTINYSIDGVNGGPDQTIPVTVSTPGEFIFTSLPYSNEGTTTLTINWIKKDTENCTYYPPNNNTVVYGLGCSTEFLQADGDDAFYVPAGVTEVTIQAFGDGSPMDSQTIDVIPGGVINIGIVGNEIFATDVPLASATMTDWLVSATGPNGRIIFHFDCAPLPPCGPGNPYEYVDSEGYTVLRFDAGCVWNAPDGLDEFEILIVGGGGGGGFGNAAGGGGGGAVEYQHYTGITMNGLPGLQGAVFPLSIGSNGSGAIAAATKGGNGQESTISGPAFESAQGTFVGFTALGGGGGGSTSATPAIRLGANGASGGGGAAYLTDESTGGTGSTGSNGGIGLGESFGTAGAGGGGVTGPGENGNGGANVMNAGAGGNGVERLISGEPIYYGAGGGGTSSGAITNNSGAGGSPYTATNGGDYFAGGSGTNNGMGQSATTYGSGGGAGSAGGSGGFPGVIYIRYPNYRILPVEYLYFNAKYNPSFRSGDLTWATAKEWESDRFEIERSVNNVKGWEMIGKVNGAGYSDQPTNYDYQDMKLPLSGGNIFYRLKQLNFDGDSTYSDTKSIRVEAMPGTSYWRVYPNPTTGNPIHLELLDSGIYTDELVTVRIISATGQFEIVQSQPGKSLDALVSDRLTTKAAGLYTLEISWGIYREYHKIVLRR